MNIKEKKGMDDIKGDSERSKSANLDSGARLDEYEEQYNANHDFAIF